MATLSRGDASGRVDRAEQPSNGASINFEDARQTPPTVLMDALQVVLPSSDTAPDVAAGATNRPNIHRRKQEQRQPNGFADTRVEASTRPETPPVALPRLETGLRCASMQMNVVLGPPGAREANELARPSLGGPLTERRPLLASAAPSEKAQDKHAEDGTIVWTTGRSPLLLQQTAETIEPPTTTADRAPAEKGAGGGRGYDDETATENDDG
ncbi:hypothetical protein ISCGN_004175 [Ixodes scapularis]